MRIRNLLLSSVMCGGVALMSSASWSQTAPKVTYTPQGDWAVTRMASSGPGKAPYCTMARRFGNNVILTFAQNGNDETSLAMDFQPKTLAKGQSYYVTLDPGANEKRAFDVTPVSDKAMVIRLGADSKFHEALGKTGALNVDVAGLQFQFNMPDMAKGSQDLSGCVTSIVEPAAGSAAAKPSDNAKADVKPVANNPAAVAAGNNEAESLREENQRLKNALERERREYEDRFMRESPGSSQVSEVMEKLKLLEKENSDLKYQLSDARSTMPKTAPVVAAAPKVETPSCEPINAKLGAEISTLRQENERLKVDMAAQKAAPAVVEAPKVAAVSCAPADPKPDAEISMLRQEIDRLKADIAAQKTAMVQLEMQAGQAKADGAKAAVDANALAGLQSRVDELVAQNSKLQADLMGAQASVAAATAAAAAPKAPAEDAISLSQLRSVEAQLSAVEKERDGLRAQMETMGEVQENGLLKLSSADWNLEQATRRYNEAEREIRRLGSQLEQARTQCTAEKKEIEYLLFDPEIATQEQISKLMALETEVNLAKDELAKKDSEVNSRIAAYEQKIAMLEGNKPGASKTDLAALGRAMAAVQPAAGTPRAPIQEKDVATVSAMLPQAVQAEPIAAPAASSRTGQVSSRVDMPATVALAPKSAIPADAFQPTQAVVAPIVPQTQMSSSVKTAPGKLITADGLSSQLRQAGLALTGNVKRADKISGPSFVAYSWDASGLFGSAEQKQMANAEQFPTLVNTYLDKVKSRCAGDFAASPVPTVTAPNVQVSSYEIVCMNPDGNGATAALAFYGKDGLFTTVAHEASMDTMEMAMDARDRVLANVIK